MASLEQGVNKLRAGLRPRREFAAGARASTAPWASQARAHDLTEAHEPCVAGARAGASLVSAEGALGIIPRHSVSRPRPLLQLFSSGNAPVATSKPPSAAPAPAGASATGSAHASAAAAAATAAAAALAHLTPAQRQRLLLRKIESVYAAVLELQDREDDNVRVAQTGTAARSFSELAADLENPAGPGAGPGAPSAAKCVRVHAESAMRAV